MNVTQDVKMPEVSVNSNMGNTAEAYRFTTMTIQSKLKNILHTDIQNMYARAYHSHIDINLLELAKMENAHTVHARGREYKYPLRSSLLERLDNLFLQKP